MQTDDPQLHYETIESRARPARVAVLIDSSDIEWRHTAVRIIEFLSSVWGGRHSVIVPTDGSTIEPAFWTVLERFSPDFVYVYRKTGADIKISHPEKYAAKLQQIFEKYGPEFTALEGEKERIDKELQHAWTDGFGLSVDLRSQIVNRLVPFHFESNMDPVTCHGVPHQLTRILDVLPYVDHPSSFTSFKVPPEVDTVWWAAQTGVYSKNVSEQLCSMSMSEATVSVSTEDLGTFADWIAGGAFNVASTRINEALGLKSGFRPPDQTRPAPFDISMSCVGLYGSPRSFRDFADHFCLVIGDSLSDFCFSYCLPRIGYRSAWLPSLWIDALQSKPGSALWNCVFPILYSVPVEVRLTAGLKICSPSRGTAYVSETLAVLKKYTSYGLNGERTHPIEPVKAVIEPTVALIPYCIDSPNHAEIYPFLGDRSVGEIRSPRPSGFSKLSATKHRWVAEVSMRSRAVPTAPYLAENFVVSSQFSGTYGARVSQLALAYNCPGSILIVNDDINAHLQNPEIRLFDTFTAVSVISAAHGYTSQLSDKGIYQRDSFEKLGGISKACSLLRDDGSRAVFEQFLDHARRKPGTYDEGCVLEQRTYLDLEAAKKLMRGDQNAAVEMLDKLTAAKVLYRGYALGCDVCKHAAWYSLADLTDEFKCVRCGREQTISHQHWKQPAAPQIFYKLDEIVYQFLRNDGDVVALGLDYMARRSKHPFNFSPEIEFRTSASASTSEIDFCAVYDGVLTIGEAKKKGELASTNSETFKIIDKYVRFAAMLNARRVLFCTKSPKWNDSAVETVHRAFQGKLAVPMFLAAEELLG